MLWRCALLLVLLTPGLAGCAGQAGVINALAKDPSTSCADLTAMYLGASLRTRWYRTGARELAGVGDSTIDVTCKDDGMQVKRTRDVPEKSPAR